MKKEIVICIALVSSFCLMDLAYAQRGMGGLGKVLTKSAKVGDNVIIHGVDDIAQIMSRNRPVREAMEKSAQRIARSSGPDAVRNALRADLQALDPSLVRYADELSGVDQQALLVMSRGAKETQGVVPDIVQRARFLERGGADTVMSVGMYDDLARSAVRLDAAIDGGRIISPAGVRPVTLQDFGKLFTTHGDSAHKFWSKYVVPHWDKWLIGGTAGCALAWYLVDPEGFMDTVGNMTQEGAKRLTQFAGDLASVVIEGVSEGLVTAAKKVGEATTNSFAKMIKTALFSWEGFVGSVTVLFGLACCFPFTRYYALRPFRILFRKPNNNP